MPFKFGYLFGTALSVAMISGACQSADMKPEDKSEVSAKAPMTTQWVVRGASGMDAVLLIGILGGDEMQTKIYGDEIEWMREDLPEKSLAAIQQIDALLRGRLGNLVGPNLSSVFSASDFTTLDDVIRTASDPDRYLKDALLASGRYDENRYGQIRRMMPVIRTALEGFKAIGYEDFYRTDVQPVIDEAIERHKQLLNQYDVIPEHRRLLARKLDPTVEMVMLNFNKPYGIRIIGQRYISHHEWDPDDQILTAVHELFHSPYDYDNPELRRRLEPLAADPWVISIVENHDPAFGYNSFKGIMDEGSTKALDQLVAERLGYAEDPGARWRRVDDGMHMVAAALYHAMKEDAFAETGGDFETWLISAFDRGMLTPDEVRRRAAEIVGEAPVQRWYDEIED